MTQFIRTVSARVPGTTVRLNILRDGRPLLATVKLAERPGQDDAAPARPDTAAPGPSPTA